jgi:para-nitrobenzyl esterase
MRRRRRCLAVIAVVVTFGCALRRDESANPVVADPATTRALRSGTVVGTAGRYGGYAWLGIPFARPPVGELRWRAPEPPEPWSGTREALRAGARCMQLASPFGGIEDVKQGEPTGAEDCLHLSVWSPAGPGDARLPVMVWIHGGGNSVGHSGFYDGSNLATKQQVVVIAVNYRLGPLGWFRHPALRAGAKDDIDASGNFGTLDLVRALEWVRDNVAAFGGDAGNVTIFGESAGGANVLSLLVSPPARGLFHRAIAQSAGLGSYSVEEAEHLRDDPVAGHRNSGGEVLLELLVRDRTVPDRAAAKAAAARMRADEVARYLRSKTASEVLSAAATGNMNGILDFPDRIRDGAVLPRETPPERFGRAGGYHQVPVMLGTTRDETKLFLFSDPNLVRLWFWILPRVRDPRTYELAAEYGSKMWKAAAADELAMAMRVAKGPPVYVYRFDWDEEPTLLGSDLSFMLGAAHAFEIPFVFGHFEMGRQANVIWTKENEPGRSALSTAMMSYWAEFAHRGDPGRGRAGDLPQWTAWDEAVESEHKYIVLDTPAGGGVRMGSEALTKAKVVAQIDADTRMPTQREKCERFRELALFSNHFRRDEYPTAGARGCREYPLDAWPWKN